jgi:acrylyl-CoA reductase (NADPH)
LDSEAWAGVIDSVGGSTLATVLPQIMAHGSVASCGLAGGAKLETTVIPFLLRGVNILGIDSVMCPIDRRRTAWSRLAKDLPVEKLDSTIQTATLENIAGYAPEILAGKVRGRVVVEI